MCASLSSPRPHRPYGTLDGRSYRPATETRRHHNTSSCSFQENWESLDLDYWEHSQWKQSFQLLLQLSISPVAISTLTLMAPVHVWVVACPFVLFALLYSCKNSDYCPRSTCTVHCKGILYHNSLYAFCSYQNIYQKILLRKELMIR